MKKLIFIIAISFELLSCSKSNPNKSMINENETLQDSIAMPSKEAIDRAIAYNTIDSAKVKSLQSLFIVKKDEFNDYAWIKPKSRPIYVNSNGFYCYFAKNNDGTVSNFRFVGQYASSEWLFIKKVVFNIDGENVQFYPEDIKTDHDTSIWEWFDEQIVSSNSDLINKIANAKKVKVRFHGDQYYDDKVMSQSNIKSIKNTLEYYKAFGGRFSSY